MPSLGRDTGTRQTKVAAIWGDGDVQRAAFTVARYLDPHLAVAGQHHPGCDAVALIGRGLRTPGPRGVSQVMRQFGVQGYPGFSDRRSERAISDQTATFPINDYLWRTQ